MPPDYWDVGPEILEQTAGQVNAFVSAVGTGGTLAGATRYLKERNAKIVIGCADPYGGAMWSWFTNGNTETNDGDSFAEGIGQSCVTKNLEGLSVDSAWRIRDQDALTILYQLMCGRPSSVDGARPSRRYFATPVRSINQSSSIRNGRRPTDRRRIVRRYPSRQVLIRKSLSAHHHTWGR
jgi:hypothetical protein